jgi:Tfp pilus assembly protein PilO
MTKMRQWSIFTAVTVVVVLAAGWFLLVKPQRSNASTLRGQAVTQQQANQQLQAQIAQLESEQRSLPKEQAELQKFATQVPNNSAEPTVIRQLSAAAAAADVDMVTLTPGAPTPVTASSTSLAPSTTSTLMALPLSISFTGTYPNVESFFQGLETLPRSMLITGWSLCPTTSATSGGSGGCSAPAPPSNKTLPAGAVGGTLSTEVFYAPPAGASTSSTLGSTTGTTTPSTTATPGATATTPTTSTTPTAAPTAAAS